jgi:anti-sigma regulatory factor (Ser/Thr protein kinase)
MRTFRPTSLNLRLRAGPGSARDLRRSLRRWLDDAGADKRDAFAVTLATTEAFTNALQHPEDPSSSLVDVEGTVSSNSITVLVRDYGQWRDGRRKKEGGLGLVIIQELMDTVEIERSRNGTTVTMRRLLPSD